MDSFLFSIGATLPVFILIVLGYYWGKSDLLDEYTATKIDKFVFKVCIPVSVGVSLAKADIKASFDLNFVLFCALGSVILFVAIWALAYLLFKNDRSVIGAFVQGSYRSSVAVLGLAFAEGLYSEIVMTPLMIAVSVPLFNAFAVIVLTLESSDRGQFSFSENLKRTAVNIITNPIIHGILIGAFVSYFDVSVPTVVMSVFEKIGVIATPLAIISLGVTFKGKEAIAKIKPTAIASFIKLVVIPMIFLPVAVYIGFRNEALLALLIFAGSPATVSCYIMAKNMKGDSTLAGSIIAVTVALSSVTLTFWIYLLRVFSLI